MKKLILAGSVSAVVLLLLLLIIISRPDPGEPLPNRDDPKNWIVPTDEGASINVGFATEGRSEQVYSQQRYVEPGGDVITTFLGGYYRGDRFRTAYYQGDSLKMRIYPDMDPYDSVLDAYAMLRIEDTQYVLYLFVDEDWKKSSGGNINIIAGDLDAPSTLTARKFDFTNNKDGVYYTRITENLDWISEGGRALLFGEITLESISSKDYSSTFVVVG